MKLDKEGKKISIQTLLSIIEDEELKNIISEMSARGVFDIHTDKIIREKIYSLEIRDWEKEKKELYHALKNFPPKEPDNLHRMAKIRELDNKIQFNLKKINNQVR